MQTHNGRSAIHWIRFLGVLLCGALMQQPILAASIPAAPQPIHNAGSSTNWTHTGTQFNTTNSTTGGLTSTPPHSASGTKTTLDIGSTGVLQINGNLFNRGTLIIDSSGPIGVLDITGRFINSGIIDFVSHAAGSSTITVNVPTVFNAQGALITSALLPGTTDASLHPVTNLNFVAQNIYNAGTFNANNLALTAAQSFHNIGSLNAAGNLNVTAPKVVNSGNMTANNINVNTALLNNNSGIIAAQTNINVLNTAGTQLSVSNLLGTMRADNILSFQTASPGVAGNKAALPQASLSVTGGDLSAKQVSFDSPDGQIAVNVNSINGGVYLNGATAAVGVASGTLNIASSHLTGDPVYYNSGGNLDISGVLTGAPTNSNGGNTFSTGGQDFVALASGNITATSALPNSVIDASSSSADGGNVVIESGVTFTTSGGGSPISCGSCSSNYSVTGNSGAGGKINLPNVSLTTNNAQIYIYAHGGSTNAGTVTVSNITNNQGATTDGGSVTITGSGNINPGAVNTFGSIAVNGNINTTPTVAGNGGNVTLSAGQYVNVTGTITANDYSSGTGGNVQITALGNNPASWLSYGNSYNPANPPTTYTGPAVSAGNITANSAGQYNGYNSISINTLNSNNNVNAVSLGSITATASGTNAYSGVVNISATGNVSTGAINTSSTGVSSSAGNVTINSNGNISTTTINTAATDASAYAGNVSLSGVGSVITTTITAGGSGAGISGGQVTLSGSSVQTGNITVATTGTSASPSYSQGIAITSKSGSITTGYLDASAYTNGYAGSIDLTSAGNVSTGYIYALGQGASGTGGPLTITATSPNNTVTINGAINLASNGTGAFGPNLSITGGTGGTITVTGTTDASSYAGGWASYINISGDTVNTGAITNDGFDGWISLNGATAVTTGSITATDTNSSTQFGYNEAGNITINQSVNGGSASAFGTVNIGAITATSSGTGCYGGNVTIYGTSISTAAINLTATGNTTQGGYGGFIYLTSSANGGSTTPSVTASGTLTASASGTGAVGGTVQITSPGAVSLAAVNVADAVGVGTISVDGGSITLHGAESASSSISLTTENSANGITLNYALTSPDVTVQSNASIALVSGVVIGQSSGVSTITSLTAEGTGGLTGINSGNLLGQSVYLTTGASVGTSTAPVALASSIQALSLTTNTSPNSGTTSPNFFLTHGGALTLYQCSVAGTLSVTTSGAGDNITVAAPLVANAITLATSSSSATYSGSITSQTSGAALTAQTITLTTGTGSIGSSATPVATQALAPGTPVTLAVSTTASTTPGSVYISHSGDLIVQSTGSKSLAALQITAVPQTGGGNGNITINGNLTASSSISLASTAASVTDAAAYLLSAPTVNLIGATGIGTSSAPVLVKTSNLSGNSASSNVYLQDTAATNGTVNLGSSSTGTGDTFSLVENGTNVTIALTGNINTGASGTVSITTTGAITDAQAMTITGSSITLSANGNIGANGAPVLLSSCATPSVTSNNGSVYLSDDTGITSINGIYAAFGDTVSVTTTGVNQNIVITANYPIPLAGAYFGTLTINASGSILSCTFCELTATTISLSGTTGIGTSATAVETTSQNLTANSSGGNVYLSVGPDANGDTLNLGNSATIPGGTFNLVATGSPMTIAFTGNINTGAAGTIYMDSIVLTTQPSFTDPHTAVLTGSNITIIGSGNIGASGAPILLSSCPTPSVNSVLGSIYISSSTAITSILNLGAAPGQTFSLATTGSNQNITIDNNVSTLLNGAGGTIVLNASGSILSTGVYSLVAGTVTLTAAGSLGTSSQPIITGSVTLNTTSGSGSVNVIAVQPGTTSTTSAPNTLSDASSEINNVLAGDWAAWTGNINNPLNVYELSLLLANPNITGSQAAVLGLIAEYMYGSGQSTLTYSATQSALTASYSYDPAYIPPTGAPTTSYAFEQGMIQAMAQLGSATTGTGALSLYGSFTGPSLTSIQQGLPGDCFMLSGIEGLLNQSPSLISSMISQTSNNTFTVTLPNGGSTLTETVKLTPAEIAAFSYATNNGCWLAVMGMAVNQAYQGQNGQAVIYSQQTMAAPFAIVAGGGDPGAALTMLTAQKYETVAAETVTITSTTVYPLSNYLTTSQMTGMIQTGLAQNQVLGLVSINHSVDIQSYNAGSGLVTILNPWGLSGQYQPEADTWTNPPPALNMTNGVITLTVPQLLADFCGITGQTSFLNSYLGGSLPSGGSALRSPTATVPLSNTYVASSSSGNVSPIANSLNNALTNLNSSMPRTLINNAIVSSLPAQVTHPNLVNTGFMATNAVAGPIAPTRQSNGAASANSRTASPSARASLITDESRDCEDIVIFEGTNIGNAQAPENVRQDSSGHPSATLEGCVSDFSDYQPVGYVSAGSAVAASSGAPSIDLKTVTNRADRTDVRHEQRVAHYALKNSAQILAASGIDADFGVNTASMRKGSVLFVPKTDIVVKTNIGGRIRIGANSVVLVVSLRDGFCVYDMHDNHAGNVQVEINGKINCLSPGRHIMIAHQCADSDFGQLNPLVSIGHRNLHRSQLDANTVQICSEFSLPSALRQLKVLRDMQRAGTDRQRDAVNKIIKDAAVIIQMDGQQVPYERYTGSDNTVVSIAQ